MSALKYDLFNRGIIKFDTDTALTNKAAQHFYEKNNSISKIFSDLYYKSRDYFYNTFEDNKEALEYYFEMTD